MQLPLKVFLFLLCPATSIAQSAPVAPGDRALLAQLDSARAIRFELATGWFRGQPVQFYHLGLTDLTPSALYRIRTGGDVLSSVPGTPGYSHLRLVYDVELTAGTDPATLHSHERVLELVSSGRARLINTRLLVNAPVVPAGSSLAGDPTARPLRSAWYQGHQVHYFEFGTTRAAAAPMIELVSAAPRGAQPTPLDGEPSLAGSAPGDREYTDLWDLALAVVGPRYSPGGYRDYRRALADGQRGQLTLLRARGTVNRPVVFVDGKPAARPTVLGGMRATGGTGKTGETGTLAKPALVAGSADGQPSTPVYPVNPVSPVEFSGLAGRVEVRIPRIEETIDVDGTLAEPVWSRAALLSGFSQYQPVDGRPANDTTQVLVWYSATAIHIGVRAFAPPGSVRATLADRDKIQADDGVQILLDTFNDGRRASVFGANALGVQSDGILSEGTNRQTSGGGSGRVDAGRDSVDLSADFQYQSRGRVTEQGYEVEFRIPFKSIRYQGSARQDWGFQVLRKTQRSGYEDTWAPARRAASFLAQSGKLVGLEGLNRGLVLDLNPVVTSKIDGQRPPAGGWNYDASRPELGGNVRWGITNNLTLNGTVKPDFSQVEADVAQVIFDPRGRTFFPEKRPFFVEGSEQFDTPNQLIYTRSIVEPEGAVKLSGKLSGTDVGVLAALDDRTLSTVTAPGAAARPFFGFARVRRDLARQSTIGLVYTGREDGSNYNRVFGADARFVFGGIYTARVQGVHSLTRMNGVATSGPLFDVGFNRQGRRFQFNYGLNGFHENFRSMSGFIRRVDIVNASASHRAVFYGRPGATVENLTVDLTGSSNWFYADFFRADEPNDLRLTLSPTFVLRGGWRVGMTWFLESWRFDPKFFANHYIERTLPGGARDTVAYTSYIPNSSSERVSDLAPVFNVQSPTGRRLALAASLAIGTDANFNEWAQAFIMNPTINVTWRPTDQLRIDARYLYQRYSRRTDGSTVQLRRVPRLRVEYQIARPLFIRLVGQYDSFTRDSLHDGARSNFPVLIRQSDGTFLRAGRFQTNSFRGDVLLAFQPNPGTVLFAGYGSSMSEPEAFRFRDLVRSSDGFFFKLSYLFRVGH